MSMRTAPKDKDGNQYGPSQVAADVAQIVHIPNKNQIVVHLLEGQNCTNPQFFGRLSGPYLGGDPVGIIRVNDHDKRGNDVNKTDCWALLRALPRTIFY